MNEEIETLSNPEHEFAEEGEEHENNKSKKAPSKRGLINNFIDKLTKLMEAEIHLPCILMIVI